MWRFTICIALVAAFAGCGGKDASSSKKYRVVVIPKGTGHQFWKSVHAGALRAAEELGNVDVIWKGPQKETDTDQQIEIVKNFISKRVDGICLAPNHSEALVEVVQEATEENIPVVIFDSGLGEGAKTVSYVATDNYRGGQLAADRLAKLIEGKGDVIMLRYRAGSESTEQREAGFLDRLKEKHPDIKVLSSSQFGEKSKRTAMEAMTPLLRKYRDEVDGVFAVCEPNCNGTLEALINTNLVGKVKFVAFDPSDELIGGMKDGSVGGIVLQDPVQMGYQSVMNMVAHLEGKKVDARIPTGEYVATPENMNTEKFDKLLNPVLADQ